MIHSRFRFTLSPTLQRIVILLTVICLVMLLTQLYSIKAMAGEIEYSWPSSEFNNSTKKKLKAPRRFKRPKTRKRSRRHSTRRALKKQHKKKYKMKHRQAGKRHKTRRHKKRKASTNSMSRMTNHEAESKRKAKVITAKTFEYPDLMTEAATKGEALFNVHCIGCHGKNALGTESGPPLLHDYYRPGHHNDVAIYAAPLYGVEAHHWKFGNMPKIEAVTKSDVHNLIIYIRTMQRANGIY